MNLELVLLDETMGPMYLAMVDEFEAAGERYPYNNIPLACENWSAFVAELRDEEAGVGLPPGIVPQWTYVLLVDGGAIAGEIRFRPDTAPPYRVGHDHVGYNVRPSYRRHGCATFMLGRVVALARARGLARMVLTVEGDNPGSVATIRKHGGHLVEQSVDGDGTSVSLYQITL